MFVGEPVGCINTYIMIGTDVIELPSYEILAKIDSGSFATVSRAQHKQTGSHVAIKFVNKARSNKQDVQNELRALKELCHPNICQLYQAIIKPQFVCLVMQLCQGEGSLHDYIKEYGRLHEELALKIFRQIVGAVNYVLDKGFCHRDIKPRNIMLESDMTVKLIDFGLAVEIEKVSVSGCRRAGTLSYLPPEVLEGNYDPIKADMWSLGVTLYEMITSHRPFVQEKDENLCDLIKSGKYKIYSYFSTGITGILAQLMEMDPTKRLSIKEVKEHPLLNSQDLKTEPKGDCLDKENLDQKCVSKLCKLYGVSQQKMRDMVAEWKFNDITANYIMTLENMKKGKDSKCLIM